MITNALSELFSATNELINDNITFSLYLYKLHKILRTI